MKAFRTIGEKRKQDPYLDRRLDIDRRETHILDYFLEGGIERRGFRERREPGERRKGYILVTKWTSIRQPGKGWTSH